MTNSGPGGPDPVEWPAGAMVADPEDTPGLAALRRHYRDWDIQPVQLGGLAGWLAVERPRPRFTAAMDLNDLRIQLRMATTRDGGDT